jgi:hypothetical protein
MQYLAKRFLLLQREPSVRIHSRRIWVIIPMKTQSLRAQLSESLKSSEFLLLLLKLLPLLLLLVAVENPNARELAKRLLM